VTEPEPATRPLFIGHEPRLAFSVLAVPLATKLATGYHHGDEPTHGRGFFAYYTESIFDDGTVRFVDPSGISGGPVLAIEHGKRALIGTARSFWEPSLELCEPAWCALEFLRAVHPDEGVRADALKGLRRLGRV
jgi:hypothetical protein